MSTLGFLSRSGEVPLSAVLLLFGVALTVVLLLTTQAHRRMVNRCEDLARRLNGTYTPGGYGTRHRVSFRALGCAHRLDLQDGKRAHLRLEVDLPGPSGGWLKIGPETFGEVFLALFRGEKFRTGDSQFDQTFVVRGWPEHVLRKLFSPDYRSTAMNAVRRLNQRAPFSIAVSGSTMEIQMAVLGEGAELPLALVRTSEELIRLLYDIDRDPGIQWGESLEKLSGRCPICTTGLREPLIRCPRCRSPHHRECWEYLGHCATYGCDPSPGRKAA